jgi:hypothetical protein
LDLSSLTRGSKGLDSSTNEVQEHSYNYCVYGLIMINMVITTKLIFTDLSMQTLTYNFSNSVKLNFHFSYAYLLKKYIEIPQIKTLLMSENSISSHLIGLN